MPTNFFNQLASLQIEGDWNITIKSGAQNRMLVSVLLVNDKIGDNARKIIPPILLKGTAQEMDDGFFTTIKNPVQQTASLFANMKAYEKAQEQAAVESKMEKEKANKEKSAKEEQKKKFEMAMKKVKELEEAGKLREAYAQLPPVEEFPEQADNLKAKQKTLMEKFEQPGLF